MEHNQTPHRFAGAVPEIASGLPCAKTLTTPGAHVRRRPLDQDGGRGRPRMRAVAALGVLSVTLCSWAGAANALECPRPHSTAARGALKEDPQEIVRLSSSFRHDDGSALPYAVASLRRGHPDAPNGEILNYLVTAYCPVADSQPGASEAQKRTRMRRFAATARALVYK